MELHCGRQEICKKQVQVPFVDSCLTHCKHKYPKLYPVRIIETAIGDHHSASWGDALTTNILVRTQVHTHPQFITHKYTQYQQLAATVHIRTHIYVHTYVYTYILMSVHSFTHTVTHTHTHAHAHVHTYTPTYVRAYVHTHYSHIQITQAGCVQHLS